MRYLLLYFLLACARHAVAVESVSLARYLAQANEQGHHIVYSDAIVLPRHRLTWDPDQPISREDVLRALEAFGLTLKVGDVSVVQKKVAAPVADTHHLVLAPPAIEEIVVSSSLHEFKMNQVTPTLDLDREDLERRANIANDVVRVASRLPGTATNGVSARTAIRGGRTNETLITFDGFRLYEPFHLHHFQDLFSVFDARTIDNIRFVTGGFPADVGDRMSGVMQISTLAPGDITEPVREAGIGLYQASYLQSGSLLGAPYLLSARRSTVDLIASRAGSDLGKPSFGDLMFRLDSTLSDETTLTTSLLWFGDKLDINNSADTERTSTSYGNTYLWFTLRNENDDRSHETRLGFGGIKDDRKGRIDKPGIVTGLLEDDQEFRVYTLEYEYQRHWEDRSLTLGGSYRYLDAEYAFVSTLEIDPAFAGISNYTRPTARSVDRNQYDGQQLAAWASIKQALSSRLYLEAGLRVDAQDYLEDEYWHEQISPRLSLLYRIAGGDLRASWGQYDQVQGIHELDISDGVDLFLDPQKSEHTIISFARTLGNTDLRIEAYRKIVNEPAPYFENIADPVSLVPELQADRVLVEPDKVESTGIELSLHTNFANSDLWLNYTRARVIEKLHGRSVHRASDQKHAANVGWSRRLSNWQLSVEATYHSGWPTSKLSLNDSGSVNPVMRNDRRLPHYLTVDFKATREWQFSRGDLRLEAGITNLLNRDNQIGTDYELVEKNGNEEIVFSPSRALPIAPFVDLYWRF